jgi:PAS domain S-box-containing protein
VTVSEHPETMDELGIYRGFVEGIPAIFYIDRPDDYSSNHYTSPQAESLLGYSQEEWETTPELWLEIVHPDDRTRVFEENRRSNQNGNHFLSEYRLIAKDGRTVWIRDEAVLVQDGDGNPLHWRGIMLDITQQKEAEEKLRLSLEVLRQSSQQRRQLMERLETAQEEERRRIAADIHDDSIQVMSAIDTRLQTLAMRGGADSTALHELHETVLEAIDRLRNLLFELRPTSLDDEGLTPTLRLFLERTGAETGLEWSLDAGRLVGEPRPEVRAALFRIVREAVMNVRKHAAASRVHVLVATDGDGVSLRVTDDGRGFDTSGPNRQRPGHLGLSNTMERAQIAGGWVRISSAPGAGTTLECWLPTDPPDRVVP